MSYIDLSKIEISNILENNYKVILNEYNNFNYNHVDIFDFLRNDTNYQEWKKLYDLSITLAKKDNKFPENSLLETYQKRYGCYGFKINKQIIWETIVLSTRKNFLGITYLQNTSICKKFFPQTFNLLKQSKEVLSISLAIFPAQREIPLHRGNKDIIRLHFGLIVPDGDIEFCVRGNRKRWENGKCFAFNDFYEHRGWNNTEKDRIILIVDLNRKGILNANI